MNLGLIKLIAEKAMCARGKVALWVERRTGD